jgi:UDP-N-acetylglucosamine--N-acetylmuramyl-(pentapeptide) pyrophosphoryl-undecaprenol N-acetylglucosamine transferase
MKKIMFCGGGSAGHVVPNLALIEQLKGDYKICYIGTNSIERQIMQEAGVDFYTFSAVKVVRGKLLCNCAIPFKLYKSVNMCKDILLKSKPDLLFCKGGYVSVAPTLAAHKLGIPVLTHESDLNAGLANKFIAGKCKQVLTAFPSTAKRFKRGIYVGTPIRRSLFDKNKLAAKAKYGFDMRPTIIIFGGGSGSQVINKATFKCIHQLCNKYNILHICGKGNMAVNKIYGYKQVEFISDMGAAYACADYAVARCGANSASELIALKIPTLFIPLENKRSRGDQVANAKYFLNKGLCHVLRESRLTPSRLLEEIENLLNDEKLKTALETNVLKCGNSNIINIIKATLR